MGFRISFPILTFEFYSSIFLKKNLPNSPDEFAIVTLGRKDYAYTHTVYPLRDSGIPGCMTCLQCHL